MRKCFSTILYAACTFRPYKSTPVLKLFRTFTGRMTRGLSLRMVFSLLFQDTLFIVLFVAALSWAWRPCRSFFPRCAWRARESFDWTRGTTPTRTPLTPRLVWLSSFSLSGWVGIGSSHFSRCPTPPPPRPPSPPCLSPPPSSYSRFD